MVEEQFDKTKRKTLPLAQVTHPEHGTTMVHAVGNFDAVCQAAKIWKVPWDTIMDSTVTSAERR